MDRRRHDYFYPGIQEGRYPPMMVVDNSSARPSAIFGFGDKVFYPSHFAPGSMRSGYRMLENLNDAERSVMFAVPEDLSKQLSKIGYTKIGSQPQPFNGEYVMKDLMVNRNASAEDFAEQMGKSVQEILDNFNGKITELNGKHYFSANPSIKSSLILK